jgi:hypothetical protein
MLVEFRLENFKCFRDPLTFSMVASRDDSLPGNVAELPSGKGLRIVKSAVVYGANASGKTTLLDALRFFTLFIRSSFKQDPDAATKITPFLLGAPATSKPTSLEAAFVAQDGVLYRYGFSLDQTTVLEEWLLSYEAGRPRQLFRRHTAEDGRPRFKFSSYLRGEKQKLTGLTRRNALFLSVGASLNNEQLGTPYRWLTRHITSVSADRLSSFPAAQMLLEMKVETARVRDLLRYADLGIVDFVLTEHELTTAAFEGAPEELRKAFQALVENLPEGARKQQRVDFIHQALGTQVSFALDDESGGTRQLFTLSPFLLPTLADGGLVIVDELNTSLHPLLVRALLRLFHSPVTNPNNAQLVFNTHDTTLLSSAIFRRDQIWFAEKAPDGASCIYSLLEYSPRKDEALEKGYLQGRYGAIPFLGEPTEGLFRHD